MVLDERTTVPIWEREGGHNLRANPWANRKPERRGRTFLSFVSALRLLQFGGTTEGLFLSFRHATFCRLQVGQITDDGSSEFRGLPYISREEGLGDKQTK